jgi:hypothetical protein
MRRLTRAIAEIDSFRSAMIKTAWHSPAELVVLGLLNTAIAALAQVQILAPTSMRRAEGIEPKVDRSDELIAQINEEMRDDDAA